MSSFAMCSFVLLSHDILFSHVGYDRRLVSIEKLENLVRATRRKDFGDWESQLFTPALCRVGGDDDRNFVRFNVKILIEGELVQALIYLFISLSPSNPTRSLSIVVRIRTPRNPPRAWRLCFAWICRCHLRSSSIREHLLLYKFDHVIHIFLKNHKLFQKPLHFLVLYLN